MATANERAGVVTGPPVDKPDVTALCVTWYWQTRATQTVGDSTTGRAEVTAVSGECLLSGGPWPYGMTSKNYSSSAGQMIVLVAVNVCSIYSPAVVFILTSTFCTQQTAVRHEAPLRIDRSPISCVCERERKGGCRASGENNNNNNKKRQRLSVFLFTNLSTAQGYCPQYLKHLTPNKGSRSGCESFVGDNKTIPCLLTLVPSQ